MKLIFISLLLSLLFPTVAYAGSFTFKRSVYVDGQPKIKQAIVDVDWYAKKECNVNLTVNIRFTERLYGRENPPVHSSAKYQFEDLPVFESGDATGTKYGLIGFEPEKMNVRYAGDSVTYKYNGERVYNTFTGIELYSIQGIKVHGFLRQSDREAAEKMQADWKALYDECRDKDKEKQAAENIKRRADKVKKAQQAAEVRKNEDKAFVEFLAKQLDYIADREWHWVAPNLFATEFVSAALSVNTATKTAIIFTDMILVSDGEEGLIDITSLPRTVRLNYFKEQQRLMWKGFDDQSITYDYKNKDYTLYANNLTKKVNEYLHHEFDFKGVVLKKDEHLIMTIHEMIAKFTFISLEGKHVTLEVQSDALNDKK